MMSMASLAPWWLDRAATDLALLPDPAWMRASMALGWALVLGFLGATAMPRQRLVWRRTLALLLALWALLPGPLSPTYWLGLAFHAPSLSAVLCCVWGLQRQLGPGVALPARPVAAAPLWWAGAAVLLGYLLLLDTFAVLPVQLYAWGFSTQALLLVLALVLLPWVVRGSTACGNLAPFWLLVPVLALLVFVLTRLPSGNVWDALLDPWLWLILQVLLLRAAWRRLKAW